MTSIFPDFEGLSHSEPNVVTKVLGVLLSDDYRQEFLPRFLACTGLDATGDWGSANTQAIFFTRPLLSYIKEQAATPANASQVQGAIDKFLGLPPGFTLRRNTDGKLTHPRGWSTKFVATMLNDNSEHTAGLGRDLCESKLWLMEEVANTEVDLILQVDSTVIFCEVKWLSEPGRASRKAALEEYEVDQLARQYLAGLYLNVSLGCAVHHLLLDRHPGAGRMDERRLSQLKELVPWAQGSFMLHHASWRDVYQVASECLSANHGLLAYIRDKEASRERGVVSLI